jgi:Rieske Fe-S protein
MLTKTITTCNGQFLCGLNNYPDEEDRMKENGKVTRREFIATTAAVGACMCGLNGCFIFPNVGDTPQINPPVYEIAASDENLDIIIDTGKVPELLNEGSSVKIIDSRIKESIIVANAGENDFIALSIACTHNGFEVEYKHDKKIFKCISLNRAEFSCEGHVIDGPTDRNLNAYPVRLQNDKLIVSMAA